MAPKKNTAHASASVKKTAKKQASKKTAASKPASKKAVLKKAVAKKLKSKPASYVSSASSSADAAIDDNTNAVPADVDESSAVATAFHNFKKLPLELRLKIWGYAAPEPVAVIQRISEKNNTRFTYRRKPPAVLHVCKESRQEYLDTDEGPESASTARRRKEHPVYRLFFSAARTRCSAALFSVDVDMFYGREYAGTNRADWKSPTWHSIRHGWGGISELDIAKYLKHLVLKTPGLYCPDFGQYFRERFPKLETLTILFPQIMLSSWPSNRVPDVPPEVGGQMNITELRSNSRLEFQSRKLKYEQVFAQEQADHPEWTPPVVLLRFQEQFIANANYTR